MNLLFGNALLRLPELAESSIDSIVTDPPYELGFMGRAWDSTGIAYNVDLWRECLRVLKPGGHLLAFGGSRTYHRLACAVEDAGFEIRDQIMWIYGQGFPKSKNLGDGWGTALKPAHEPIVMARKPFVGSATVNHQQYGVGGLHIEACRVPGEPVPINKLANWSGFGQEKRPDYEATVNDLGRWPANLIHDGSEEVAEAFPQAPGQLAAVKYDAEERTPQGIYGAMKRGHEPSADSRYTEAGSTNFAMKPGARRLDSGPAARFFYCAKASKRDRNSGLHGIVEVIISLWGNVGLKATLLVDTGHYPPKVIFVSGTQNNSVTEWSTMLFGKDTTGLFQMASMCITETKSKLTMKSEIWNYFQNFITSASTRAANLGMESGGSLAGSAEDGTLSITTTSEWMGSALGVVPAAREMQLKISASAAVSRHPTVKPIALMRYLCRLVTPPRGTVLDPFTGSGSTGCAALLEGFDFIGIEKEQPYFEIAKARITATLRELEIPIVADSPSPNPASCATMNLEA